MSKRLRRTRSFEAKSTAFGSSTDAKIVEEVKKRAEGKKVLVILDSDHRKDHVLNELRAYSSLVPVGGYVIVQDTNINGHPVFKEHGPGP